MSTKATRLDTDPRLCDAVLRAIIETCKVSLFLRDGRRDEERMRRQEAHLLAVLKKAGL